MSALIWFGSWGALYVVLAEEVKVKTTWSQNPSNVSTMQASDVPALGWAATCLPTRCVWGACGLWRV